MRSATRIAWWLCAVLVVASWSAAAGLQIVRESSGVGHSAGSTARPSVLSDLPRLVASETDRPKLIRGYDGKSFGLVPEALALPALAHPALGPTRRSGATPVRVRAFEARGPPSMIV